MDHRNQGSNASHDTHATRKNSVVVFGSLNMDLAIESDRMPQQGETIPGQNFFINAGGKGANQAVAAAKFGAVTRMIGAIGTDVFGEQLVTGLEGYGVACGQVQRIDDVETGVAIVLRSGGDNRIILNPGANCALGITEVGAALDQIAHPGDVFLAQLECDVETTVAALESAHARGMVTVLNAAPAQDLDARVWASVDVLCVNETECEAICGILPVDEVSLHRALEALVALGPTTAIITLGERGSAALSEGHMTRQSALLVNAVDTTAAGDTFIGVVAAARAQGCTFTEAMHQASCAAALTATRVGAQQAIPTKAEVEAYLKEVGNE